MVAGNSATGLVQLGAGAVMKTLGNNHIVDNNSDLSGTLTPVAPR
jgi:hypothetical protein